MLQSGAVNASVLAQGTALGGDFVVVRQLGRGGMGAVYVAEQRSTGKLRALKVMHGDIAPNEALQRRFEQEARIGSQIRSGHVVEVVAAGFDAPTGLPYLVMELLDGVDLRTHLRTRGPLDVAEVRALFEQLCHGMAAAHAAGIVHRDLKPENIFLARPNQAGSTASVVKVLDFGIAKLASEAATQATAAIGSPLWMAPEQTAPGPVTPAADVWALGLIAYELFTGEHFWRSAALPSATPMYLLREIVVEPIPPASQRGGGRLPEGFDAWFARCVARDPLARFANAGEAWAAMRHFLSPSGHFGSADAYPAGPAAELAPTVAADPAALAFSPTSPAGHTPLAVAGAISPAAHTAASGSAGTASATGSRVALSVGAGIAVVGVVVGALLGRGSSGSAAPLATHPPVPSPPAVPEPEDDSTRSVAGPKTADGFADPDDGARETPGSPQVKTIGQHRVRILTRLVSNGGNVAEEVIRSGVDWSSWRYTRCYETAFGTGREYPGGTVTVAFDILDQLPRHAVQQASTFKSASMNDCILRTLSGQTLNAAGAAGAGHVVYAFKFVVD